MRGITRSHAWLATAVGLITMLGATNGHAQSFVNFESGQVRPLAQAGNRLYAVNTPDNRLEIYDVTGGSLSHLESVPVGLDPVAVAARNANEVWVVNHLSDSISIVDVSSSPARVTRTILTCDEPRDIVFAGPGGNRAFITTARRGQNCPVSADLTTAGTPRALVQVYDATSLGTSLAGDVLTTVELFGDTPRPLATDGNSVWAGVFHSGNQTVPIQEQAVCDGGAGAPTCNVGGLTMPGGLPAPNADHNGVPQPEVGLIVKFHAPSGEWRDELGRDWSNAVRFNLPDLDVFEIDANSNPPVETDDFAGVGTILFNMVVNPSNGNVYVSNTDAINEVRFEGFAGLASTTVNGHLHEARITVLDGANVDSRHLNKHINYNVIPSPPGVKDDTLAQPTGMAITSDGATLYVAAYGSGKLGVFDTTALENDTFTPDGNSHIGLSAGGPTGLVLDEANNRIYVMTRFDNGISVVDTGSASEVDHQTLPVNPEPTHVVQGRQFLYDADFSSSNGESSCGSCHIFGDFDSLSWDLGDPDVDVLNNPIPTRIGPLGIPNDFHGMKGPMTTQTLRGMANHGSLHWRGDRTGGNDFDSNAFDEFRAFEKFNPAFVGLLGRDTELTPAEMADFADFALSIIMPPNPIRALDNSLTTQEQLGRNFYFGPISDTLFNCNGCHTLNPAQGFFGTDGFATFEGESQMFKIPHTRNAYQKVGMFGTLGTPHMGDQVRGTGFLHDGAIDTVFNFLSAGVFQLNNADRANLEAFTMAFPSNMDPIVGQQTTLNGTNGGIVGGRINLLIQRAAAGECDVVAKSVMGGIPRGAVRLPSGDFQLDRLAEVMTDAALRATAATAGQEITYTCVPPGSGTRIGVDRDDDGFFDQDEVDLGTDPNDAGSFPGAPTGIRASVLRIRDNANVARRRFTFRSAKYQGSPSGVVVPAFATPSDPTVGGAELTVFKVGGTVDDVVVHSLPNVNWRRVGTPAKPGYVYRDPTGTIRRVTLRNGKLVIRGRGGGVYPLADAPQGEMAIQITMGIGLGWCSAAPSRIPAPLFDNTSRFIGEKNTDAPAVCPTVPEPPYGSASRAFMNAAPLTIAD